MRYDHRPIDKLFDELYDVLDKNASVEFKADRMAVLEGLMTLRRKVHRGAERRHKQAGVTPADPAQVSCLDNTCAD